MSDPTPPAIVETAKRILFVLVNEQGLRVGDDIDPAVLRADLARHQIGDAEQQQALDHARQQGWLRPGPQGALQLTQAGFALD